MCRRAASDGSGHRHLRPRPDGSGECTELADLRGPARYLTPGSSSFTDFLALAEPQLLPGHSGAAALPASELRHGTTITALTFADGVVMAGDRRATMGPMIAQRDIQKVFVTDTFSVIGIAGTAGIAIEMARLFQLELEHYEKIEGVRLSFDGKANRLAAMIRGNLSAALQGLAVVPLFAGFDTDRAATARMAQMPVRCCMPAGSSPTTSPAAGTRSSSTTRSVPVRCSPVPR